MIDLAAEMAAAEREVADEHRARMEELGVPTGVPTGGPAWGIAAVEPAGSGFYEPGAGKAHVIVPVVDADDLIDLIAFRTSKPDRWLHRRGSFLLGDDVRERGETWGDPVAFFATPLDWLRASGNGCVVLDWDGGWDWSRIRSLPAITAATAGLGRRLESAVRASVRFPAILVPEEARRAA